MVAGRKSMLYTTFKQSRSHGCYGCKTPGNVEVLTEALAVWIPTGGLAVDPRQLCKLLTGIITTLTTNWGFPASNRVENKNRKDPGHRASYCLVESIDISNAVELAVRSEERRVGKECRSRWSPYH